MRWGGEGGVGREAVVPRADAATHFPLPGQARVPALSRRDDGAERACDAMCESNSPAALSEERGTMPRLSIRIDFDQEGRLGPGKVALLERIASEGSISAAGRSMNMSYKRAWELVAEINQSFTEPLVSAQTGGKTGGRPGPTPPRREPSRPYPP